jgi:hypothetical protein
LRGSLKHLRTTIFALGLSKSRYDFVIRTRDAGWV